LRRQLTQNAKAMGENIAVLWPGETTKAWKGLPPGRPIRPVADDIVFLEQRVPELKAVIGEITSWRTALEYGPKTVNARLTGVNIPYGEARKHYAQAGGRFLSPLDEANKRRVIFLGDELAKDIFGNEDPIAKTLLVNDSPYTVIGVMQKKVQMGAYGGPDADHAVIPLSTFRAQFSRERLSNIVIQVHEPQQMKLALRRVYETLGAKYGFDPTDERALGTWDTVKTSQVTVNVSIGIQLFLGIIGALTLLIGGVGVANIMYAVVKERTREIGVKMALGAKRSWIIGPFLLEGLSYTLVGGTLGIVIATLLVTGLSFIPTKGNDVMEFLGKPTLSIEIGVLVSLILGFIGVLAGYFPARRAASVDPAATLRYE
jgi:putative ABC transport system permease protein